MAIPPRLALLLLTLTLAGCSRQPSAPPLSDDPVYKNSQEGFRFTAPEGWKQRARGNAPPGKLAKERMLAEYKSLTAGNTILMVTVVDIPESTSLGDYITKNTHTGEEWKLSGAAEDFTINAMPATRISYVQGAGKNQSIREIVAFRRGERVYLFKGIYYKSDTRSRTAIRNAVDTIVW